MPTKEEIVRYKEILSVVQRHREGKASSEELLRIPNDEYLAAQDWVLDMVNALTERDIPDIWEDGLE